MSRAFMRRTTVATFICATAISLGACGDDEDDAPAGAGAGASSTTTAAEEKPSQDSGTQLLEALRANAKKSGPPDTPRPAQKGKTIAWMVNGMNNASSAQIQRAGMAGCKVIGWKCNLLDGKSDPTTYPGLVRSAIASKPDGLIVQGIDCQAISQPLKEVKKAGIKIAGVDSYDCDDPKVGGTKQLDGAVLYTDPMDSSKVIKDAEQATIFGRAKAALAMSKAKGPINAISICTKELLILVYICEGSSKQFKDAGVKFTEVETRFADLGPKLESQVTSALLKNPDANIIVSPFGAATLIIAPAVRKAGKKAKMVVMGSEGLVPELDMIRGGLLDGVISAPTAQKGWSAVDTMNSVFAGTPPVTSGLAQLPVDKENIPAEKGTNIPADTFVDYQSAYKKAWGVG